MSETCTTKMGKVFDAVKTFQTIYIVLKHLERQCSFDDSDTWVMFIVTWKFAPVTVPDTETTSVRSQECYRVIVKV